MRQLILATALATVLAGCATLKVERQFDPTTDFAAYKTYAWNPMPPGPEEAEAMRFPEAMALVQQAVDRQLAARGLKRVEPEQADLLVAAHGQGKDRLQINTYGYKEPVGPYGYSGPLTGAPKVSTADATLYRDGTLILDLVDARTKVVVWRGTAEDTVKDAAQLKAVIDAGVKELLEDYPPRKK